MATTSTSSSTTSTTPTQPLINYFSRDFATLRNDLINYVKTYHSDQFRYFNDANPDMMLLELMAYSGDTLNYQIDRSFNEAFRLTAQSRESFIRIAQDLGFYNYFHKPSSTQVILSINVPAVPNADGSAMIPDSQYLFGIYAGMSIQGDNGTTFECLDETNFSQDFNRTIIPNLDSNNQLIDFTVQKAIVVTAGQTKIQRYYVSSSTAKPFLEVILDDTQVTQIVGVVSVAGNSFDVPSDEDFRNSPNVYVEVENLSQATIFAPINPLPVDVQNIINVYTDMTINYGEWVNKPKRFVVRHDKNNQTSLIFGSTLVDYTTWNQVIGGVDTSTLTNFSLNQVLNNMSLGEVPPIDSTLFIKFRSGAGTSTNVLTNSISTIIDKQIFYSTTPASTSVSSQVQNSLQVISNLPAVGGTNALSNDEIKNSVGKIFATNDRLVTYEDTKALVQKMPAQFGQPFRISFEEIKPQLLSYTQLQNYVSSQLDLLLTDPTTTDRQARVQQMKTYIANYPSQVALINSQTGTSLTLAQIADALNNSSNINEHGLWYGEKCRLYVLGIDSNLIPTTIYKDTNGIWQSPNELLKLNIKNYLSEKRLIGDWIDIVDGSVVNFQINFKIIADKKNKQQVLVNCLTALRDYFNVYNWNFNQPIFLGNVQTILQGVEGVINVSQITFINIWDKDLTSGLQYSPIEIGRYKYLTGSALNTQNNKYLMQTFDNTIVSFPNTFLHCRYPDSDIIGSVIN